MAQEFNDSIPEDVFGKSSGKESKNYHEKSNKKSIGLWAVVGVLLVALIVSVLTKGFTSWGGSEPTGAVTAPVTPGQVTFTILNDKNCADCDTANVKAVTNQLFPNAKVTEVDFNSKEGQAMYKKYGIKFLPAYLFNLEVEKQQTFSQVAQAMVKVDDQYMILPDAVGAKYNPYGEKCGNGIDDNNNGKIDCQDDDCKGTLDCMEKLDKPKVEAFVMSHCPYGTQIEKGLIPVVEKLGNKIDFSVKFVHYSMHGDKEVKEELNQYCIETEQNAKYLSYLKCFLKEGNGAQCLTDTKIDTAKLDTCVKATDEKYKVTDNFNDKTKWLGNYPPFDIFKDLTTKYGVQGSPTLVLNGMQVESARDSASLLKTICSGFKTKPAECDAQLSSAQPAPGFGEAVAAANAPAASCAT